jgi:hypothetical protein
MPDSDPQHCLLQPPAISWRRDTVLALTKCELCSFLKKDEIVVVQFPPGALFRGRAFRCIRIRPQIFHVQTENKILKPLEK